MWSRKRIDALGTREPTIIRQGEDRIVVQVPGLQDPQALKDLLGKTAKLEFKLVDEAASPTDTRKETRLRQPDRALCRSGEAALPRSRCERLGGIQGRSADQCAAEL